MLSEESRKVLQGHIDYLKRQRESASKGLRDAQEDVEFHQTTLAEIDAKMSLLRADLEA